MNPKIKAMIQLASALSAALGLRSKFREARQKNDRLVLIDSVITTLGLVTGVALAVRTLRKGDDE